MNFVTEGKKSHLFSNKHGWGLVNGLNCRYHFFVNQESLCGKYKSNNSPQEKEFLDNKKLYDGMSCVKCVSVFTKLYKQMSRHKITIFEKDLFNK